MINLERSTKKMKEFPLGWKSSPSTERVLLELKCSARECTKIL
jgi:hypothetical protein